MSNICKKKKNKIKTFLPKSKVDEASSDITAGVPVSCALILRIALQPHVHTCTHTCTDVCMAYSGRHACQQRWRALSWLLLSQPFPPQKGARLGEGEGKSWLSEHQTASGEQSQQAETTTGWKEISLKRSLPHRKPTKGWSSREHCLPLPHLPVGPVNYICSP